MAKKPKPKVTQKHVDNANEIAQLLAAHLAGQQEDQEPQAATPPVGVSPLGGQAK